MKKTVGTYFTQYFKMPHLFRDDLQAIEKVIRNELKPKKYNLAVDGYEYTALEQVPAELQDTHVLVIYTHTPCMRLKFARSWTELYAEDDEPNTGDAVRKIGQLVEHGERHWLWTICKNAPWLAPLIGFGSFALVVAWIAMGLIALRSIYLVSLLMIMTSVWWAVGYRFKLQTFSRIDFQRVRSRGPWLVRHRNAIAIFLGGLVLGGLLSWLLAEFFQSAS